MKIETDRLLLRPFKKEDVSDLFEYLHEPLVNCFANIVLKYNNFFETAGIKSRNNTKNARPGTGRASIV